MEAGFAKVDITPRVGVELSGFGPFLHRRATEVRDRLFARAMAVADGESRWVIVSADLVGLDADTVARARELLAESTGIAPGRVMLHATHTHSGPAVVGYLIGWGEPDVPYLARLPHLLARAARDALADLGDAEFTCAEVPVEGIGYSRELDERPAYDDALRDDWRPAHPEHTDTTGYVVSARRGGRLAGFLSCYSCHPVVCCEQTHSIHGDYCGVAMSALEAANDGAVGLFLQGAHGDVNTCVCHMPQAESMRALDVIAERFARCLRPGIGAGRAMKTEPLAAATRTLTVRHEDMTAGQLRAEIDAQRRAILDDPAGDAGRDARMAAVRLTAAGKMLARLEVGGTLDDAAEVQALRLGELLIVGAPFELFRGVKEQVRRALGREPALVLSNTNGALGYAVTGEISRRKGPGHYARDLAPWIHGVPPFRADLADEIVAACAAVAGEL